MKELSQLNSVMRNFIFLLFLGFCLPLQSLFAQNCEITITQAEAYCVSNAVFIDFEMDTANTSGLSDIFIVSFNGTDYGSFTLGQQFYTIQLFGYNTGLENLNVYMNDDLTCTDEFLVDLPDCGIYCDIYVTTSEAYCDGANSLIDFEIVEPPYPGYGFQAFYEGIYMGTFPYGQAYYTINVSGLGTGTNQLLIEDLDIPTCNSVTIASALDCSSSNCNIEFQNVVPYCDFVLDETVASFNVLNYGNPGQSFNVYFEGTLVGNFAYAQQDFLVILSSFEGTAGNLVIEDADDPSCSDYYGITVPICDCGINFAVYETFCAQDDPFITFEIEEPANNSSGFFEVYLDGSSLGNYPYGQINYTIALDASNPNSVLTLVDVDDSSCNISLGFYTPECQCMMDITSLNVGCDAISSVVNFDLATNMTTGGFEVQFVGQTVDFFNYGTTSYTVDLSSYAGASGELLLIDNDDPNCTTNTFVNVPDCSFNCDLFITNYETYCDNDTPYIDFEVSAGSGVSTSFDVYLDGVYMGYLPYNEPFYTIDITNFSSGALLYIEDTNNDNCLAEIQFYGINCNSNCTIDLLNLNQVCYNYLTLGYFEVDGAGTGSMFQVYFNNQFISNEPYNQYSYQVDLTPFVGQTGTLEIRDIDNSICSSEVNITVDDCSASCSIENFEYEYGNCTGDGFVSIELEFDVVNGNGSGFDVFLDGNYVGYYPDYPANGGTLYEGILPADGMQHFITIVDNDNPTCIIVEEIFSPTCGTNPDCGFGGYGQFFSYCIGGQSYLNLEMVENPTSSSGFEIELNGVTYGPIPFGQDNYNIPVDLITAAISYVTLTDVDNPSCNIPDMIVPNTCPYECDLSDTELFAAPCTNNEFALNLTFPSISPGGSGFNVFVDGVLHTSIGTYPNGTVGIFPIIVDYPGQQYEILVQDDENESCVYYEVIAAPYCDNCVMDIFNVESTCNGYDSELSFDLYSSYFYGDIEIFVDGNSAGVYPAGLNSYTVIIPSGYGFTDLWVVNLSNPFCSASESFIQEDCPDICDLTISNIQTFCDGPYPYVQFDLNGTVFGNQFYVMFDGVLMGVFPTGDLTYVAPLPSNYGATGLLDVYDNFNQGCIANELVTIPDCSSYCQLQLENVSTYCDGNTTMVEFDLNAQSPGASGFELYFGSDSIGVFAYGQTTYSIPVPSGLGFFDQLFINDLDDETCEDDYDVWLPGCDCQLFNPVLDVNPCTTDTTFSITLDFDAYAPSSPGFNFFSSWFNETYNYTDLPITIDGLIGDGSFYPEFLITDIASGGSCFLEVPGFDSPVCEPSDDCQLNDLELSFDCLGNDEVSVTIDFSFSNSGTEGFNLQINNDPEVFYTYAQLPVTVGPLVGDGMTPYNITLTDIDSLACSETISVPEISCVWPGDADDSRLANNNDILNLGLTYNFTGPARDEQGILWQAYAADSWDGSFASGVNHKHADCNGDGIVNDDDLIALDNNYGFEHNKTNEDLSVYSENDAPLYVDLPTSVLNGGESVEVPIILGDMSIQVEDIYGLAFTIEYDATIIDSSSVTVDLSDTWLGDVNSELISIHKNPAAGIIEIGVSRTTHMAISGFGQIGTLGFVLMENVEGKMAAELVVDIKHVKAITYHEEEIILNTDPRSVDVISGIEEPVVDLVEIYPNPTSGQIIINDDLYAGLKNIAIFNTQGALLMNVPKENSSTLNISHLPEGLYWLRLEMLDGSMKNASVIKH